MAGGDELSARLPAAERVLLPVRSKQRTIIAFLTAEKIRPIQIHAILKTAYGDDCISVLMSVRFAVGRNAPLKPVMLLVMSNLVTPPAAVASTSPSQHDRTAEQKLCWSANQGESQHFQRVTCIRVEWFSRTCAGDYRQCLGTEQFVRIMPDTAQVRRQRTHCKDWTSSASITQRTTQTLLHRTTTCSAGWGSIWGAVDSLATTS